MNTVVLPYYLGVAVETVQGVRPKLASLAVQHLGGLDGVLVEGGRASMHWSPVVMRTRGLDDLPPYTR